MATDPDVARMGVDVPDTRAWRLREMRGAHPLVGALLDWRKAERIATTYGYAWLDEHLAADGRLRGAWTGSDGAAGRMTASAGLHNMPAALRPAVIADEGHMFVRADLRSLDAGNEALAGQPPAALLARGAGQLRLTALSRLLPQETLRRATGSTIEAQPYLDYLRRTYA